MFAVLPISTGSQLAIGMPDGFEWVIIAAIALLIFGKRLPDVVRRFGRDADDFSHEPGLRGVQNVARAGPPPPRVLQRGGLASQGPHPLAFVALAIMIILVWRMESASTLPSPSSAPPTPATQLAAPHP